VEEILRRYNKGAINGPQLVDRMLAGEQWNRKEWMFAIKVLAKYLMIFSSIICILVAVNDSQLTKLAVLPKACSCKAFSLN
jgi:hypothetical protein